MALHLTGDERAALIACDRALRRSGRRFVPVRTNARAGGAYGERLVAALVGRGALAWGNRARSFAVRTGLGDEIAEASHG